MDYGDGKLFEDNGNTALGNQIGLRSDLANSGSIEDISKLANSYIDATSQVLRGLAKHLGVDFSSKSGRKKVTAEFEKHRKVLEHAIKILSANNLMREDQEE